MPDNDPLSSVPTDIRYMQRDIGDIKEMLKGMDLTFATKEEMRGMSERLTARISLLEKLVYGAVGLILVSFMGAIIALVITAR